MVILYHRTPFGTTERGGYPYSLPAGSFAAARSAYPGVRPPGPPDGLRPRGYSYSLPAGSFAAARSAYPGVRPPGPPDGLRPRRLRSDVPASPA